MAGEAALAVAPTRGYHQRPAKARSAGRVLSVAVAAAAVALLAPSAAQARAPVLQSVGIGFGHATAQWSISAKVQSIVLEISTSPATGSGGYFRQAGLVTIEVLADDQTSLTPDDCGSCLLQKGQTYYIHVAGEDTAYRACPRREWSDVMKLTVSADGGSVVAEDVGGGSPLCPKFATRGGGGGGGGGSPGSLAPFFRVFSARRVQAVDKLYVTAAMSEAGTLAARATVNVRGGSSRIYRFKPVSRKVGGGVRTKLRLKLSKQSLRAVERAVRKGKRLSAKIVVTATDKDGNVRIQREKVRLKP
jgi:hypothetical protein